MSNALMVVFTGVIAVATVVYAVVTFFLWRATKRSADAAKESADSAKLSAEAGKKSADIDAALHRPYLGVYELRRHNDYNVDMWAIRWCVKNYGTLPAAETRIDVSVERDGRGDFGRGPVCNDWEILPQAELEGFLQIRVDRDARDQISSGEPMVAHVKITYRAPGGTGYTHIADFAYDRTTRNFRPDRSKTTGGNP